MDLSDFKQSNIGRRSFTSESGETHIVGTKCSFILMEIRTSTGEESEKALPQFTYHLCYLVQLSGSAKCSFFDLHHETKPALFLMLLAMHGILSLKTDEGSCCFQNKYYNFEKFAKNTQRVAGHSMWYYLRTNYGRSTVSNLLYLTHITQFWKSGICANTPIRQIYEEWADYLVRFVQEGGQIWWTCRQEIKLSIKKTSPSPICMPSLDGKWLFIRLTMPEKLYLHKNNDSGKSQGFPNTLKNKFRRQTSNIPILLEWQRSWIFITTQRRDQIYIRKYNIRDFKIRRAIVAQRGATCLQHRIHR